MTIRYISIDIHKVSKEFLSEKININNLTKAIHALVYGTEDDIYFLSSLSSEQMASVDIEFICNTQEEFIQKINEHKLLKLLG